MNLIFTSIAVLAATVVVVEILRPAKKAKRSATRRVDPVDFNVPHSPRDALTPTEKKFFQTLQSIGAVQGFVVAPQMAMSAIVDTPQKFNENKFRNKNRAGFAQKRLDFVLLDHRHLRTVLVIELDDPSHDGREAEDSQREDILAEAGHRLLRVDVREQLTKEQLEKRIFKVLSSLNG